MRLIILLVLLATALFSCHTLKMSGASLEVNNKPNKPVHVYLINRTASYIYCVNKLKRAPTNFIYVGTTKHHDAITCAEAK